MDDPDGDLTKLLNQAASGDGEAARKVFPVIYRELRGLASSRLRSRPADDTLRTTALVHEAYVRIVGRHPAGWESLRHFYFTAARAMRDILVEEARRKGSAKRGSHAPRVPLDELTLALDTPSEAIEALEAALVRLESEDAQGCQLVMLRFYAGLTLPEISNLLETPLRTLERKWRFLRAWLASEMEGPEA